ncbi:MAG: hypothetical protein LCI00_02705 [Chloroflexi bacterium]|nr:hypothetical protein [Chloroflexota bacterium]MCC6893497.1 hypothetical protein [Anaerolineae bacterium]
MQKTLKVLLVTLVILLTLSLPTLFVNAGQLVLTNNSGDGNTTWFITGEQTMVMNGFDLTAKGLTFPATIDKVSIAVDTAVSTTPVDIVVYQDANGGSPVDATVAGQAQATITQGGVFTYTFPTPVTITQPVVWVGFYLPVDFKFYSDNSGSSVLSYWAWTPGSRFDITKLSTATVLGPSNGTAPVSLNMNGIARITAEISSAAAGVPTIVPVATGVAGSGQIASDPNTDLSPLKVYPPACDTLFWDSEDVGISLGGKYEPRCTAIWPGYAPGAPAGYVRQQMYYDITFYNNKGQPQNNAINIPITHCIMANPADIDRAIIGLASGSPRSFKILPTLRVGNLVCAEIDRSGGISYFVPG